MDFCASVDGAAKCRSPRGWQPKRGVLGTPMDVGERVEKVDVDWLGLG